MRRPRGLHTLIHRLSFPPTNTQSVSCRFASLHATYGSIYTYIYIIRNKPLLISFSIGSYAILVDVILLPLASVSFFLIHIMSSFAALSRLSSQLQPGRLTNFIYRHQSYGSGFLP
ncbi:hypothetical protein F5X97DRAFT_79018 [Nemania serpens]|nr:hypothetical protein F5X97DRAFT_79018 [Nemania serpens]